jgi:ATP-binding cassette subfamily B (MDR/TAP) protein 1
MMMMVGGMMIMVGSGLGLKDIPTAKQAAKLFFEATDRKPAINSRSEEGLKPSSVKGDIEVKDVVFAYPSAPDHLVCKGYTVSIPAGQTVALSGASGSGKSTIIQLLLRFYDPSSGSVLLDGVDIKTLNVRWLRSQMGYVGQEPVLFTGTVAENISYGKAGGEATREEIEAAAKMANAHGFISESLAEGYATQVGIGGGQLSGGQKQRVAIARAIIRKPAILLLDEATSALDNESERVVQGALDELMAKQKRTTVVIAHRLSTIRHADKIAVVDKGKVAEEGTHDELMAMKALYYHLIEVAEGRS